VPGWLVAIAVLGANYGLRLLDDVHRHESAAVATNRLHAAVDGTAALITAIDDARQFTPDQLDAYRAADREVMDAEAGVGASSLAQRESDELVAATDEARRAAAADIASFRQAGTWTSPLLGADDIRVYRRFESATARSLRRIDRDSASAMAVARHGLVALAGIEVVSIVCLLCWEGARRRREAEGAIRRRAEAHHAALVTGASDLIAVTGASGKLTYVSPASRRMLGYGSDQLVGTTLTDLIHPEDRELASATMADVLAGANLRTVVLRARHRTGAWRHLECLTTNRTAEPTIEGIVWNARDITDRKVLDDRLAHQAYHDSLTNLPNRAALIELIDGQLDDGAEGRALLMVDVGRLDRVNDVHGHRLGDQVLVRCAQRLVLAAHDTDVVARISDHCFAMWCDHAWDPSVALAYAEQVEVAMAGAFSAAGIDIHVSGDVAVAVAERGERVGALELVRRVDTALVRARREGRAQIYDQSMDDELHRQFEVEALVTQAVADGAVSLGYQPIVRLDDQRTVGAEALLRLTDESGRPVPAMEVATAAERCGRMGELTGLVLRAACADAARWHRLAPERSIGVSVNISASQLDDPDLPDRVRLALDETGLAPGALTLEITESALMGDPVRSARLLTALRLLGIKLAAADFGSGHSSIAYLKSFPLDTLKIDRAFVAGLPGNVEEVAITRAIVVMADALGLTVVAEGVEGEAQRNALLELGIGWGQGFLWSAALPLIDFEARLVIEADDPQATANAAGPGGPGLEPRQRVTPSSQERMDAVLQMLAHEIRSPLTVVRGYADLLASTSDPDQAKAAGAIARAAERITRIVADVASMSTAADSSGPVEIQVVEAAALVDALVADMGAAIPNRLVVVERPDVDVTVAVDVVQIGQVVNNLVNNAAKFSPADSVIEVAISASEGAVDVAVMDHGPGIDTDDLGHIFRKYGRGDHNVRGTGLGLYVSRRIARTHGGDLLYRRRLPGPGSIFTLRIPRHDAIAPAQVERRGMGARRHR
jgi:diguanylate cyclase (GGDEF)-like protein/PAS domain S-box-containing protein